MLGKNWVNFIYIANIDFIEPLYPFTNNSAYHLYVIKIDFESKLTSIEEALDDLMSISTILTKNNIDSDVYFVEEIIKIELK